MDLLHSVPSRGVYTPPPGALYVRQVGNKHGEENKKKKHGYKSRWVITRLINHLLRTTPFYAIHPINAPSYKLIAMMFIVVIVVVIAVAIIPSHFGSCHCHNHYDLFMFML